MTSRSNKKESRRSGGNEDVWQYSNDVLRSQPTLAQHQDSAHGCDLQSKHSGDELLPTSSTRGQKLATLKEHADSLGPAIQVKVRRQADQQKSNEDLEHQLNAAKSEIEEMRRRIETLETENKKLKTKITDQDAKHHALWEESERIIELVTEKVTNAKRMIDEL